MRQAINNLQSTFSGFGFVSAENVYKVCDQPHPVVINGIVEGCAQQDVEGALDKLRSLWADGYSALDIITTLFRVVKVHPELPEALKLDFIKVSGSVRDASKLIDMSFLALICLVNEYQLPLLFEFHNVQEIGFTHMKILEGVTTLVQLSGLIARLAKMSMRSDLFEV